MEFPGLEVGPQFWRELLAEVTPPGKMFPVDPSRMLRSPDARTQGYRQAGPGMGSGGAPNWQQMLTDPDGLRKWLMQMMFAGRMGGL